jgi:hypothetical protein
MFFTKLAALCILAYAIGFAAANPAVAEKLTATWTAPTQNANGTPLTDLRSYRIEWGSCKADGTFGTYQAGINVGAPETSAPIYPTNLSPICLRFYAINSANRLSVTPSYFKYSGP